MLHKVHIKYASVHKIFLREHWVIGTIDLILLKSLLWFEKSQR